MPFILSFLLVFIASCTPYKSVSIQVPNPNNKANRTCLAPETESITESNINYDELAEQLQGEGLGGWVHGAVQSQSVFVFTWRKPGSFFVNVSLPMTSTNPTVMEKLKNIRRHDHVVIKGKFINNQAPIRHISVSEIVEIKEWAGLGSDLEYEYSTQLPEDILAKTEIIGKVHAVANGGSVLVVEVGDRVIPVFNKNPDLAKGLYRNDKIELFYKVLNVGADGPKHLSVDVEKDNSICILEKTLAGHDQPIELTGMLVFFPESPQITRNVFAVRIEDSDKVRRNYTMLSFTNIELFDALTEKLDKVWEDNLATAKYDRNKFINPKIIISVKGTKNVISPKQANPQVILNKLEDLSIQILEN